MFLLSFPIIILIFFLWAKYERDKATRESRKAQEAFWLRESKSNSVRKKDLSCLPYIYIPLDSLPFQDTDDDILEECQKIVKTLSGKKILNLNGRSNTDLKTDYGTANLTELMIYDENFTLLTCTLKRWGFRLHETGNTEGSIAVLEYAVSVHTDIGSIYKLLAELYKFQDEAQKIRTLIEKAEKIPSMLKSSICASLENILNR